MDPVFLPPGAPLPGHSNALDRPLPGYSAEDRKRVETWIDGERQLFKRNGVAQPEGARPVRVEWAVTLPAASFVPAANVLRLGETPNTHIPYSRSDDVVRHEYAHAVLANGLGLGEPQTLEAVTLHESLADTFAAALDDDWTMGEDLVVGDARPQRSMSDPASGPIPPTADPPYGVDRLPAHMREWSYSTHNPHANMGVPSHAAQLIGDRLGRERMAGIYISALRDHLPDRQLTVRGLARATLEASANESERAAVVDAWRAVGLTPSSTR